MTYFEKSWGTAQEGKTTAVGLLDMTLYLATFDLLSNVPDEHKESYAKIASIYEKLRETKVLVSRWNSKDSWVEEVNASGGHYQKKYVALQIVEHIMFHT